MMQPSNSRVLVASRNDSLAVVFRLGTITALLLAMLAAGSALAGATPPDPAVALEESPQLPTRASLDEF